MFIIMLITAGIRIITVMVFTDLVTALDIQTFPPQQKELYLEVLSALMNLGYKRKESEKAIERALRKEEDPEGVGLEALLKSTLRELIRDT